MRKYLFTVALLAAMLLVLAACGGGEKAEPEPTQPPAQEEQQPALPAGDTAKGQELFASSCAACHGPTGEGIQGLGKDMTTSDFIAGLSDAELLDFVKKGRDTGDPANTTGVAMPPKGGNPALSDEQLLDIIAYIRSIHK